MGAADAGPAAETGQPVLLVLINMITIMIIIIVIIIIIIMIMIIVIVIVTSRGTSRALRSRSPWAAMAGGQCTKERGEAPEAAARGPAGRGRSSGASPAARAGTAAILYLICSCLRFQSLGFETESSKSYLRPPWTTY